MIRYSGNTTTPPRDVACQKDRNEVLGTGHPSPFAVALKHWRDVRGYSCDRLAALVGCEAEDIRNLESGVVASSAVLAKKIDEVLAADGAVAASHTAVSATGQHLAGVGRPEPDDGAVVLLDDHTTLRFDGSKYWVRQVHRILNAGAQSFSYYSMRLSVDRYPGSAERSRRHHEEYPLEMPMINFTATRDSRPLSWELVHDTNAFKEIRLNLADGREMFALDPGCEAQLEFQYHVDASTWGKWLQRIVSRPTMALEVSIGLPAGLGLTVGGHQLEKTAGALPITSLEHRREDGLDIYSWRAQRPGVDSVFRFEWWPSRWASPSNDDEYAKVATANRTMREAGIIQSDDHLLRTRSSKFILPAEAEHCQKVLELASVTLDRLARIHQFAKGQGIAAVQIGISRAAAVIRSPDCGNLYLVNPQIIREASETDVQFEGCLSLFHVRGRVARPRWIEVEYEDLTGKRMVSLFRDGVARMVAHEIDHINGYLYPSRMSSEEHLVPLSRYAEIGKTWNYAPTSG